MNKLLFKFERSFNDDITLIANNHKDLEDYITENFDWCFFEITEDRVAIKEQVGNATEYVTLEWVKHI